MPTNDASTAHSVRPMLSAATLAALGAGAMLAGYNATFWSKGLEIFAGHPVQLAIFVAAIWCLTLSFFGLFAVRAVIRPFLAAMLLLSAATSWYVDTLGVVIDRGMIQNVVTTTLAESRQLLTPGFAIHLALFGLLPAAALLLVRVRPFGWIATFAVPVLLFAGGLAGSAALLMTNYKTYASVIRERGDLIESYQPGAPLVEAVRYARMMTRAARRPMEAIGTDARKGGIYGPDRKPVVLILVAGETARAQDFSMNGYAVPTNPELAARPVVSFTDVTSCGTATAVSLPCMFSRYAREDYSHEKGVTTESLLDVLAHAGFVVEWWDNNTGDKGVAARLPRREMTAEDDAAACASGECTDAVFEPALETFLDDVTQDTVLVLHQIGSHGPTYHLRYPQGFGPFQPACPTAEFADCTPEEIVRAYDNTIAFTDHVLARTIDMLAVRDGLETAMLYVSDHGESLGEGGLYLHGAPWFVAPDVQTHVPMIFWTSDAFAARRGLDGACVAARRDDPLSHDNLFHSVLGLLDVTTQVRDPALDLFAPCTTSVVAG